MFSENCSRPIWANSRRTLESCPVKPCSHTLERGVEHHAGRTLPEPLLNQRPLRGNNDWNVARSLGCPNAATISAPPARGRVDPAFGAD